MGKDDNKNVLLGLTETQVEMLDVLCDVNDRSRPKLVGLLIEHAHAAFKKKPSSRINPSPETAR